MHEASRPLGDQRLECEETVLQVWRVCHPVDAQLLPFFSFVLYCHAYDSGPGPTICCSFSSRSRKGEGADKPEFDERLGACVALLNEAADKAADRWYVSHKRTAKRWHRMPRMITLLALTYLPPSPAILLQARVVEANNRGADEGHRNEGVLCQLPCVCTYRGRTRARWSPRPIYKRAMFAADDVLTHVLLWPRRHGKK
jgi:hypothetical protein